jgi:hypothetical protein
MLNVELDEVNGIAMLSPNGALSEKDFQSASDVIDSYIGKHGNLKGVVIHTKAFPGWESLGSLIEHFKFIKDHHKNVSHVALVTDSVLGDFGEKIAAHFVSAEIKHFPFAELANAQSWILNTEPR